ncbi:hypothetical protein [Cumulibacter soli]|uniref:hypothetical protein n=1 Tax=Cumulibacter soli TaxID=2546344 RepID=UPI00106732C4|nr:hypothetical protein [Cumulibacter soli]
MSDVFDADALLDSANDFKAKVGGSVLEFRRFGMMSPAERKLMKPLIEAREMLFRRAAQIARQSEDDLELSFTEINEDIHMNLVEQLKLACTGTAAQKKKLGELPSDVAEKIYDAYNERTELGEASPSSDS